MRQVVIARPPEEKEKRRTEVSPNRVSYNPYAHDVGKKATITIRRGNPLYYMDWYKLGINLFFLFSSIPMKAVLPLITSALQSSHRLYH